MGYTQLCVVHTLASRLPRRPFLPGYVFSVTCMRVHSGFYGKLCYQVLCSSCGVCPYIQVATTKSVTGLCVVCYLVYSDQHHKKNRDHMNQYHIEKD